MGKVSGLGGLNAGISGVMLRDRSFMACLGGGDNADTGDVGVDNAVSLHGNFVSV